MPLFVGQSGLCLLSQNLVPEVVWNLAFWGHGHKQSWANWKIRQVRSCEQITPKPASVNRTWANSDQKNSRAFASDNFSHNFASDNFVEVDAVTSTGSDWLNAAAITLVAQTDKASLFGEIS